MEEQQPDDILMDLKMPNMDGIEATKKVREKYAHVKIIVLTMYEDDNFIVHLIENGANAYLLKRENLSELTRAITSLDLLSHVRGTLRPSLGRPDYEPPALDRRAF